MTEYQCRCCGEVFESLESKPARAIAEHETCASAPSDSSALADKVMSAPRGGVNYARTAWVEQTGPADEPPPGAMTTRHLARE